MSHEEGWEPRYVGIQCKGGRVCAGPALPPPAPPTTRLAWWNAGRPGGWGQAAKVSPVVQKQLRADLAAAANNVRTIVITSFNFLIFKFVRKLRSRRKHLKYSIEIIDKCFPVIKKWK